MKILKGAEISAKIKAEVMEWLETKPEEIPKLAIVRVGENPDDLSYERNAIKKLENFGLRAESHAFPINVTQEVFFRELQKLNADPEICGILVLRPLPPQICEKEIEILIDPKKDLDGISPWNQAKVFSGDPTGFAPCTAEAVIEVLKGNDITISGKRVVIVGRSMVVGRPLAMLLLRENATVTICHTRTKQLQEECRRADILVVAAGRAKLIDQEYVREGAIVIDVGIHVDEDGKLCGDVDFASIQETASMATPVPGGVGAVTTAVLAKHLMQAGKASV